MKKRLIRSIPSAIALVCIVWMWCLAHYAWYALVLIAGYAFCIVFDPKLKWEPRDTWVGLFHDKVEGRWQYHVPNGISIHHRFRLYLVIIPCLPLVWDWVITTKHNTVDEASKCAEGLKTLFHVPFYKDPPI